MDKKEMVEKLATELTKVLTDQGKLIEAGFAAFAHYVIPKDAPTAQVQDMRLAFMAGAEHLFSSIMGILDPGDEEPTEDDMRRMDLIAKEIDDWRAKLHAAVHSPKGT